MLPYILMTPFALLTLCLIALLAVCLIDIIRLEIKRDPHALQGMLFGLGFLLSLIAFGCGADMLEQQRKAKLEVEMNGPK